MSLLSELEAHAPEYIEWRHTFHEHPELGLETPWTADLVAAKLRSFGEKIFFVNDSYCKSGKVVLIFRHK